MENQLIVTTVPSSDETFARALNITKERESELDNLMEKYHGCTDTYTTALAGVSEHVSNVNELVYLAFHLGAFAEKQRTKHEQLSKLLGEKQS